MLHHILRPRQALNKAYLRLKTSRADIETFKLGLRTLLDSINLHESEEHAKNHLRDFLQSVFYVKYGINTKGKTDLVIHTGATTKTKAGVLLEVKRPTNKTDMPALDNLNAKAVHELLLYYMRERVQDKNHDLRHLIVTSVHEWYVFDALEFDRLFYRNTAFKKAYTDWQEGRKASTSTDFFYKEIAAPFIAQLPEQITFTHFNLQDYKKPLLNKDLKDDVKLVALYKLLSPVHLLKEPFANDANSLDRGFYQELLHIIGLEEVKEKGRKLIRRKERPDHASLLEATLQKLRSEDLLSNFNDLHTFGSTREEQLFNVSLELCITWINRVLFLKLLEAQLISYHHGDQGFAFMSTKQLQEFDDLNELFFDVLAERPQYRSGHVRQKFAHIPYLNSSLFETTALEKRTMRISNLKDRSRLPLYPQTVLRDGQGKSLAKVAAPELHTLEYLLRFLGSYDFGAEGKEEIQEENKTLITASVLGLIFEKINGYRDGSFYTPGFITMYMSREAIRRAVVQQFSQKYGWSIEDRLSGPAFESLHLHVSRNYTPEKVREYNQLINSLRICDPAVGSGHYLVSALNELIVIKAELRLLLNRQGKPLHYGSIEVQNDELIVTDHHGELFSYHVHQHPDGHRTVNPQVQELQEALFHEKQTIIENCLFGVDINPNSVKICRLRLWIELLKNAYYVNQDFQDVDRKNRMPVDSTSSNSDNFKNPVNPNHPENPDSDTSSPVCYANTSGLREGFGAEEKVAPYTELQTLPNIDINIKQGNSLLSRYALSADLTEAFGKKGHSLQAYREAVASYKHTNSKADKARLVQFLEEIKQGFQTTLANNDPMRARMSKLRGQIAVMQDPDLFGAKKVDKAKLAKLKKELQKHETERAAIETNKVYEGAFEWRFEFPEVLDEQGNYRGFDVVLGNPPYGLAFSSEEKKLIDGDYTTVQYNYESYSLFHERSIELLKIEGFLSFIVPNTFLVVEQGDIFRNYFYSKSQVIQIVETLDVFDDAVVETLFYTCKKVGSAKSNYEIDIKVRPRGLPASEFSNYVINSAYKEDIYKNDSLMFNYRAEGEALVLYNKLRSSRFSFSDHCSISAGVKLYEKSKGNPNQTKEIIKNRTYNSFTKHDDEWKPLIKGGNIKRYIIDWDGEYVKYGANLAAPRKPEIFLNDKIFIRRTDDTIMACIDELSMIGVNSVHVLKSLSESIRLKFLLAILNSRLINWFFQFENFHMVGKPLAEVKLVYVQRLPLIVAENQLQSISLVEQILAAKQADAAADTSALEAEIDLLVYRLYHLTYEEVLLVEPEFALPREAYEANLSLQL